MPTLLWLLAVVLLTENANAQRDTSANSMVPGCNEVLTRQEEIDRYDKGLLGQAFGVNFRTAAAEARQGDHLVLSEPAFDGVSIGASDGGAGIISA